MELLRQVRVIDPVAQSDRPMDVLLDAGKISAIASQLDAPADVEVFDGAGLVFGPALIDLYSRSGEPGYEERETLASLAAAAAAGGFGQVNLLPNTSPTIDNPGTVAWLQQHQPDSTVSLKPWGAITLGVKGEQLTELGDLALAGVAGFADGKPLTNLGLLRRFLEYAKPMAQPIMLWPYDVPLACGGLAREGVEALRFGLPGQPVYAETTALSAIIELVAEIGTPVHLMRISTARSVALIQQAKAAGMPITASTTWLHLLYDTSDLATYDPNLRLNPPLGNAADREALVAAVKTGVIDAIAVDHSPYTYEEKTVAFGEAPIGTLGLELALPMLWQGLVETGNLSAIELWSALSSRAASCIQQNVSAVESETSGYVLFDTGAEWQVNSGSLHSLSQNTHLLGQMVKGKALKLFH
ncbi:dihydroorotase [filamentous cyanobacterium LEGE 11480]|uniref:Dihydroorotase n=1 Tax=Romeriopsis navalis LEGE 11480 TaxID=2777977 RepID=A0A928VP16_9CYAN|nr:dihydroorotase [Romeriopsis navalis]MBE9029504.1 dihydroorotase [Romeriopsis navalis LEGE 11480]